MKKIFKSFVSMVIDPLKDKETRMFMYFMMEYIMFIFMCFMTSLCSPIYTFLLMLLGVSLPFSAIKWYKEPTKEQKELAKRINELKKKIDESNRNLDKLLK